MRLIIQTFIISAVLVALSGMAVCAQGKTDKLVWRTGKVVLYIYTADTKTITFDYTDIFTDPPRTEKRDISARNDHLRMDVQTNQGTFMVNQDLKYIWQKKLDIKAGDSVQVAARDGSIYLKTSKGKKAKYRYDLLVPNEPDQAH